LFHKAVQVLEQPGDNKIPLDKLEAAFRTRVLFFIFREITDAATPHIRANSEGLTSAI
jgi:hypothetical protein